MKVSTNDDSIVATSDWTWMTRCALNRKAEAAKVLERITPKMDSSRTRPITVVC